VKVKGYQYDGDPKLSITESGSDIESIGGQPVMDRGLENYVLISMFTRKGWAGNSVLKALGHAEVGEDFEVLSLNKALTISAMESQASAAKKALSGMVKAGLASKVDVEWRNPEKDVYVLTPIIHPPGNGSAASFMLTKNGPNWNNQKKDPAYQRVEVS